MTEAEWLASEDPAAMLRYLLEGCGVCDGTGRTGGTTSPELVCSRCGGRQPEKPSDRKLRLFAVACADLFGLSGHYGVDGEWVADPTAEAVRWAGQAEGGGGVSGRWSPEAAAHLLRDIIGNPFRPVNLLPEPTPESPRCLGCGSEHCDHESGECRCADCGGNRWSQSFAPQAWWRNAEALTLAHAAYEDRDQANGHLDPVRLAVLADALEEAGCVQQSGRTAEEVLAARRGLIGCCSRHADNMACDCLILAAPEGVLNHLRSPGPHVRGCHVVDLILGKE